MLELKWSLNKFVIRSHNGAIMCLFDRTEDSVNILTWTMISMQLTEAWLRKWGAVVLSLEAADGMVKTALKHPRKWFNLF